MGASQPVACNRAIGGNGDGCMSVVTHTPPPLHTHLPTPPPHTLCRDHCQHLARGGTVREVRRVG